jgi:hypothetical protein
MVMARSGQDVSQCRACLDCDIEIRDGMDIPLSSLVQLILHGDTEVLDCRTLWSQAALESARGACQRGLDLQAVMLALRGIAQQADSTA